MKYKINNAKLKLFEVWGIFTISAAVGLMIKYGTYEEMVKDISLTLGSIALFLLGILIWYLKELMSKEGILTK